VLPTTTRRSRTSTADIAPMNAEDDVLSPSVVSLFHALGHPPDDVRRPFSIVRARAMSSPFCRSQKLRSSVSGFKRDKKDEKNAETIRVRIVNARNRKLLLLLLLTPALSPEVRGVEERRSAVS